MDIAVTLENRQLKPAVVNTFQYENQVTTLNFTLDSYMYEEVDLRNFKAFAITSIKGIVDITELEMNYDETDDVLMLSWDLGNYTLQEDGAITYQIVFKENADDDDLGSAAWYSYNAVIINRGSVDADYKIVAEYPTIMSQWLRKMDDKQVELEQHIDTTVESEFEATNNELVAYINYISSSVNACVIYIPYGQTVEIADRLESRLYYQYMDEAHSMGRFEDHLGNILSNENTGGASLPLFAYMWADHLLNDISYLRADTFSWQDGEVYQAGYEHLFNDIYGVKYYCFARYNNVTGEQGTDLYLDSDTPSPDSTMYVKTDSGMSVLGSGSINENGQLVIGSVLNGEEIVVYNLVRNSELDVVDLIVEPQTETIGDVEITYYLGADKLKICLADQEANVQSIYDNTGVAWYYILDTENKRFKLPRLQGDDTNLYLYFYVGNSVRNATEIDMGALAEIVNDFDITTFQEEVNAVTESAIAEIKADPVIEDLQTQIDAGDYVIESYSDEDGNWYRVYKSGWIEQGGIISDGESTSTVTLLKSMKDLNYIPKVSLFGNTSADTSNPKIEIVDETTMNIYTFANSAISSTKSWEVKGYKGE